MLLVLRGLQLLQILRRLSFRYTIVRQQHPAPLQGHDTTVTSK
eukprot:COSAG01_NODE_31519_length_596_cov_0.790744_1_plen_42_part_10